MRCKRERLRISVREKNYEMKNKERLSTMEVGRYFCRYICCISRKKFGFRICVRFRNA